jgi:hypothetical protein
MTGSPTCKALSEAITTLHFKSQEKSFALAPALEELAPKIMDGRPQPTAERLHDIFLEAMKMKSLEEVLDFLRSAKAEV